MAKTSSLLNLFYRVGFFDLLHTLWPNRLTVLAYHRITNPHAPEFDTFKPNVSATPAEFAKQIAYLAQRFNVVSVDDVAAWLQGRRSLPPQPALITFDDGYYDNFEHAFPVLQKHNLPAVIFLATNYIGQSKPFFWDLVAYCFYHTRQDSANLPLLGERHWVDAASRDATMRNWLAVLKTVPDDQKWQMVNALPALLNVTLSADAFAGMLLSWDEARTLAANGVAMGAHTQSHPILTRIPLEQARTEIVGSKARIEAEIGQPVTSFAYPNGLPTDFNADLQAVLANAGIASAYTLVPGPSRLAETRAAPLTIRRVYLGHRDTLPRFAAKVMGIPRLTGLFS